MSAILFDMDGTLINSEPLWLEAEIEVMREVGSTWDQSDQINCLGGPMERTEKYMQERSGNIKPFGYFGRRLNEIMDQKLKTQLDLMPNAMELLLECKSANIPMALVTASSRSQMEIVLSQLPKGIFGAAVSKNDVEKSKPDPAPYLLAAELLKVDIKSCLVIEDSTTGIQSGLKSGAKVVGIPHLEQIQSSPNLKVISSLSELSLRTLVDWYPQLNTGVGVK